MTSLNLLSPLRYLPFEGSAGELLEAFRDGETGTDGLLSIAFIYSDGLDLGFLAKGLRPPMTAEERRMIESGMELPGKTGETVILPSGSYQFSQLPAVTGEEDLRPILMPWCGETSHCYLRLFKESPLRSVTQIFIPCR